MLVNVDQIGQSIACNHVRMVVVLRAPALAGTVAGIGRDLRSIGLILALIIRSGLSDGLLRLWIRNCCFRGNGKNRSTFTNCNPAIFLAGLMLLLISSLSLFFRELRSEVISEDIVALMVLSCVGR